MFNFDVFDFHVHCGWAHNMYHHPQNLNLLFVDKQMKGALCSSLSGIFDRETGENDLRQVIKIPHIVGAYWVNPYLSSWKENIIHFCRGYNNVPCIKLSPIANIYEPTEKFLEPVWAFCNDYHKFIVIHTDPYRSCAHKLIPMLRKYPKVKVVLYHFNVGLENIHIAKMFSQIYLETSFAEKELNCMSLQIALDVVGVDRLLFGTDFPIGNPVKNFSHKMKVEDSFTAKRWWKHRYEPLIYLINSSVCGNDRRKTEQILYKNAQQFLKNYSIII